MNKRDKRKRDEFFHDHICLIRGKLTKSLVELKQVTELNTSETIFLEGYLGIKLEKLMKKLDK
jgi:hypothetical protein